MTSLTINRSLMSKSLNLLKKAFGSSVKLQVRFAEDDGGTCCYMTTHSHGLAGFLRFPVDCVEFPYPLQQNLDQFLQLIQSFEKDFSIEFKKDSFVLKSGGTKYKIAVSEEARNNDSFLWIDWNAFGTPMVVSNGPDFSRVLGKIGKLIQSSAVPHEILQSVCWRIGPDGCQLFGSDGYRVFVVQGDQETLRSESAQCVVVPACAMEILESFEDKDHQLKIGFSDTHFLIEVKTTNFEFLLHGVLVQGNYPDFRVLLEKDPQIYYQLNKKSFEEKVRLHTTLEKKDKHLRGTFVFNENQIQILSKIGHELETIVDGEIIVENSCPPETSVSLNLRMNYVTEGLSLMCVPLKSEQVELCLLENSVVWIRQAPEDWQNQGLKIMCIFAATVE